MTKKQLKAKAEKAIAWLEDNQRYYQGTGNIYCVNVKRYNDYVDIEDIAKTYSKRVCEAIIEEFKTENYHSRVDDIYRDWLEYEGRYFIEDFLHGCTINSKEHYQELRDDVNAGKDTCYPYLNKCRTLKTKLAWINKYDKQDRKIQSYLNVLDIKSAGLYGRSGGWFGIQSDVADNLEALIYDIDNGQSMADIDATHDYTGYFLEVSAIQWVLNEADQFNKGLNFEEELKYRIEEYVDEVEADLKREKEIKTAKTLASRYGYLLAKAV